VDLIYVLDASFFLQLFVMAYLSKRIGEALMIPPYYKSFYYIAGIIVMASLTGIFIKGLADTETIYFITFIIRAAASVSAIPICFKYWSWLFNEDMRG
jgi:uncharacterized membrane protein